MIFGIGMYRDMTLVQMSGDGFTGIGGGESAAVTGAVDLFGQAGLRDQQCHTGTLRVIILLGDIQHGGAYHFSYLTKNTGQTLGVILLVNIGDIVLLLPLCFGVAHIIDVKAQGLGQVIKSVQLQSFFQCYSHDLLVIFPGSYDFPFSFWRIILAHI